MIEPSARISRVAPSATMKVDAKAKALAAEGRPVISFGAGEPDFPTPDHIVEAAVAAARDPKNHRYTPAAGLPALRRAIADKTERDSALAVEPSQVVVTNGGKQAVYQAFATLINDGDQVLLPAPYWTSYPEAIGLAGGEPVEVFAGADQGYKVTVDQLEAARTERTRGFVFVSPSNPTGSVYTDAEIAAIGEWLLANRLWVMTDEIYQTLTYDGVRARSIVDVVPDLAGQTVLVNGVAKQYAMTGWRVGWLIGPPPIAGAAATLQSHLCSNVANVSQQAALAALTGPQDPAAEMLEAFARRRKLILELLRRIPGVEVPTPDGAFYAYADVTGLLGRTWGGNDVRSSLDLADLLLDKAEIAAVPGEAFGPSGFLRFSYALSDDAITEGIGRFADVVAAG